MKTHYIMDNLFSHAHSSSGFNKPTSVHWERNKIGDHLVVTDSLLPASEGIPVKRKFAWLMESPVVTPRAYEYIRHNYHKFDRVYTFDRDLLELSDKFSLLPIGGCWIDESERAVFPKSRMASMILSSKAFTQGQQLRHEIYGALKTDPVDLDFYGYMNHVKNKSEALKDYRFSIVVENCSMDYYFTEKIIDCFMTGTVPIYWGCPSIGDFFDTGGILKFSTLEELKETLSNLCVELYDSMKHSIEQNFMKCHEYAIADDRLAQMLSLELDTKGE